ncbi:hypothetical protein M9434_006824 [Picochlorum sp. BPE23]|nr:hypothetical protein M9434_006824 [Picochlorum sp. BPE23]
MIPGKPTKVYLPDDVRRASLSASNEAPIPIEDDEWIESQVVLPLYRELNSDRCSTARELELQRLIEKEDYLWYSNKTSSNRWLLQKIKVREVGDTSSRISPTKIAWVFLESCSTSRPVPCLLKGRLLYICDLSSSNKIIPLLEHYDSIFPTYRGVLLVNHSANKISFLKHHEEPMIDVRIPDGERIGKVVWSSSRLPIVATCVSIGQCMSIRLWRVVVRQGGEIHLEGLKEKKIRGQVHIEMLEESQTGNHILVLNDAGQDSRSSEGSSVILWYLKDFVVTSEKVMDASIMKVLPLHMDVSSQFLLVLLRDGSLCLWSSDGERRLFDLVLQTEQEHALISLAPGHCVPFPTATAFADIFDVSGCNATIKSLDGQESRVRLSILPISSWMRENLDCVHFPPAGRANEHFLDWRNLLTPDEEVQHMLENPYDILQESNEHSSILHNVFRESHEPNKISENHFFSELCLNALDMHLVHEGMGKYSNPLPSYNLLRGNETGKRTKDAIEICSHVKDLCRLFNDEEHPEILRNGSLSIARAMTDYLVRNKWTLEDVQKLPFNLAIPVFLLLKIAATDPNQLQSASGFVLLDRPDFAAQSKIWSLQDPAYNMFHEDVIIPRMDEDVNSILESIDGYVDNLTPEMMEHRFGRDTRVFEARKILSSSEPVPLFLNDSAHAGEADMQQQQLKLLSNRTLAVCVGRGAMALCTHQSLPTEPLNICRVNLSGRVVDRNDAIVNLDLTQELPAPGGGAVCKLTAWPEFHNGVASALRIAPGGTLSRTWIVYNKSDEPSYEHAGILLGLGLTGQLSCLTMTDLYSYLSHEHDPTLVGVLLGTSSSKRCSMDSTLTKMLFLHLPARHPIGYPDLEISPVVQCASLIGLGQLYLGSAQRSIVETLLQEIERSPRQDGEDKKQVNDFTKSFKSYSLCAGFALGLVCLGKGADPSMEAKLQYLMVGGTRFGNVARKSTLAKVCDVNGDYCQEDFINELISSSVQNPGKDSNRSSGVAEELAAAQADARTIMEGDLINLNTTSPAATVALGFMYLKSGKRRVAEIFHIPNSIFELRLCNPQHLCLRVLMKNLILWDDLDASADWIDAQIPGFLHETTDLSKYSEPDIYLLSQARFFLLSGCCLALGIRFAGSENRTVKGLIEKHLNYFLRRKSECQGNRERKENLEILESCIVDCALSLAVLMAGSGDLSTFSICRALLNRVPTASNTQNAITYGSYVGLSMATGFLFLSGGMRTFGTSTEDVAYLVMSIFPALSVSSSDNRAHLQALRHFYVLATHQRIVDQIDVRSNRYLESPIRLGDSEPDRQISYNDTSENFVFDRYLQRSFEGVPGVEIDNAFRNRGVSPSVLGYFHESGSVEGQKDIDFTCGNFAVRSITATFPRLLASILQVLSSDSAEQEQKILDLWSTLSAISEKIDLCGFPDLHQNGLQMLCAQSLSRNI